MENISQALYRVVKGTGFLFIGTIISMVLGFLTIIIIARCFSKAEYGLYNLVSTIGHCQDWGFNKQKFRYNKVRKNKVWDEFLRS